MFSLAIHKQFLKDFNKIKFNQTNLEKLFKYILLLQQEKPLPEEAKDHGLKGEYQNIRDFHLSGDLIVLYRIDKENMEIQLLRIGSHSQLFK